MRSLIVLFSMLIGAIPADAGDLIGRASVIDGDTIVIHGVHVRFDGVDAPESRQICLDGRGKKYRCGQVSANALDAFLSQAVPARCRPTGKSYDRVVAICWRADGVEVNQWLVANGYAVDWQKYSKGRYAAEQGKARGARLGVWSGSFDMPCVFRGKAC